MAPVVTRGMSGVMTVTSVLMLTTVRDRAPAIDWIAAVIVGHHHTRPVNGAAAGAAMTGDTS